MKWHFSNAGTIGTHSICLEYQGVRILGAAGNILVGVTMRIWHTFYGSGYMMAVSGLLQRPLMPSWR